MKKEMFGGQPNLITVIAQAMWNEDEGVWEVHLTSQENFKESSTGQYCLNQRTATIKVEDCDEFVVADALLHLNGISVQKLYQTAINPIVE